jgi:hypothetical protein
MSFGDERDDAEPVPAPARRPGIDLTDQDRELLARELGVSETATVRLALVGLARNPRPLRRVGADRGRLP